MGYKSLLYAFDVYPLPHDQAARGLLSKKAVRPWHIRRRLVDGIQKFMEGIQAPTDVSRVPKPFQKLAATWSDARMRRSVIGDAVVMDIALRPDDRHFPAHALDAMLNAACTAALLQLMAGEDDPEDTLPLRGGIDIGTGAVFDGELYSAGLAKAVVLEGDAFFPRILVGARLRQYVESMENEGGDDLTAQHVREMMGATRGFFFEDPGDGKWCLDFLGRHFARRAPAASKFIQPAREFIRKALLHYTDEHLRQKYQWLDTYMRSRLSVWGMA